MKVQRKLLLAKRRTKQYWRNMAKESAFNTNPRMKRSPAVSGLSMCLDETTSRVSE